MLLAPPRDSEASRRTPAIPPAGWKGVPHTVDYLYFTFEPMDEGYELEGLGFPSYDMIHVVGDKACPNCKEPPLPCELPACHGLMHSAEQFDGDETGVNSWDEKKCDVCGAIGRLRSLRRGSLLLMRGRYQKEQMRLAEEQRRKDHPTVAEKFSDWLEFVRKEAGNYPAGAGGPGWPTLGLPLSWDQFKDEDRHEFFGLVEAKVKDLPNDVILRTGAISLYWKLSRRIPGEFIRGLFIDEDSAEGYGERAYWHPDDSERWKSHRQEFSGLLARLVKLVNVQDCSDWQRTFCEIRNASAAQEWDLARQLFRHAEEGNQYPADKLCAAQACFEYRIVFGPEIDKIVGLGTGNEREIQWEWLRDEFLNGLELSLDALGPWWLPFDHLYAEHSELADSATLLCFIWGALQDEPPKLQRYDRDALRNAARALDDLVGTPSPHQDFFLSILAQCREALGETRQAAEIYQKIASRPDPFEGWHFSCPLALKAAKLYVKVGDTRKAEDVLDSSLKRHPDDVETLEELLRLKWARGAASEADTLLEHLGTLTEEANCAPDTRAIMVARRQSTVSQTAVDTKVQNFRFSSQLCPSSKKALEVACRCELRADADADQSARDADLCISAFYYAKVVERELKEKVFEPFRAEVLNSDLGVEITQQLRTGDGPLDTYIYHNKRLALGQMISVIGASGLKGFLQKNRFRRLRYQPILKNLNELNHLRNEERHADLDPKLAARARTLAQSVIEAMYEKT
jgi:tetratricopeptide (TPR) repeat protein